MTHIPQSDILSTKNLSRVFNSTTATYKFYWFQSLLQMHNEEGAYRMNVWDLVIRMVANAWFYCQGQGCGMCSKTGMDKCIHCDGRGFNYM